MCVVPAGHERTRWPPIVKSAPAHGVAPNLRDYDHARAAFSWDAARRRLDGLPGGSGLNIAHEAVDRHAGRLDGNRLALRWISRAGIRRDFTYDDLRGATNRFANALGRLGVGSGDVVATLAGRIPPLYIAALGALKNRSVYTPLFSAFGPDPIVSRLTIARARVLVTTETLYRRKVEAVRARMPALEHVLLVRESGGPLPRGTRDWSELLDAASDEGWRSGSLSAEILARIAECAFYDLDAPVSRVCSAEVPVPYPKHLEDASLPQPHAIVEAVRRLMPSAVSSS